MIICLFGVRYKEGYDKKLEAKLDEMLIEALRTVQGFVSFHSYSAEDGEVLGVIRFDSKDALEAWRNDPTHRSVWHIAPDFYEHFYIQNAETYREYGWRPEGKRGVRTGEDLRDKFASEPSNRGRADE
ncbi:antibiotic biosynthesis monooxygenase family protein [Leucobacter japonicus]|uniref:antibiotic biosynthesis monooxygenase family protein n=1 Tax=Leucobacter japonicus TaxID=1461259 RepID=UPI0006A76053|nr:antibiotic biosynthesis monooxygenase [Leucobacter japonicus]